MSSFLACKMLEDFPTMLEEEVDEDAHRWSVGEAANVLACIRRGRSNLAIVERRVEMLVVEAAGDDKVIQVAGLGAVEIKRAAGRKGWDHEELIRVITARALDERRANGATGEYEPAHEAVARVLTACAHVDYWRKGELELRGLDIDDFCKTTWGDARVKLP